MNYKIGYARVSSLYQNLDSQIDSLKKVGCNKIFTDKSTGKNIFRKGWQDLLHHVREQDTIIVTELSRMTRSLMDLLKIVNELEKKKINLISLRENINTTTATGRCFLSMMGAIYQMERELKAERAATGRISAKARGKTGGRPKIDIEKLESARILYENSNKTANQVCKLNGISRRTLFNYLQKYRMNCNILSNIENK